MIGSSSMDYDCPNPLLSLVNLVDLKVGKYLHNNKLVQRQPAILVILLNINGKKFKLQNMFKNI